MRKACIAYWQCRHTFVCFAGIVEKSRAEKSSETALSDAADEVFGNDWWYVYNTNVCFREYFNVATLTGG
jgi:hypothetical protein